MMSERFTYTNGNIKDNQCKGDTNLLYKLNSDEGRLELVEFMNDREKMIVALNDDIAKLQEELEDGITRYRNSQKQLRKQERLTLLYKEMVQLMMELIGEIE